jgi:hypothetical protein
VVLFYLANLVAAAIIVLPLAALLGWRLAHSFESDRLFTNLDPAWVAETIYQVGRTPAVGVVATAALVGVLLLVLNTFLAGGALAVFHREDDTFFGASARFFPRLLRLLVISLFFYGLVVALNLGLAAAIARARENSMEARPWVILGWIRWLLVLFLFGGVNILFDYAKVFCVVDGYRSTLRATAKAIGFVSRHARQVLAISWICAAIALLLLATYHALTEVVRQSSTVMVLVVFAIRQVYTLARIYTRLWTWSSEVGYFEHAAYLSRVIPPIEAEPAPPPDEPDQTLSSTMVAPEPPSLGVAG